MSCNYSKTPVLGLCGDHLQWHKIQGRMFLWVSGQDHTKSV